MGNTVPSKNKKISSQRQSVKTLPKDVITDDVKWTIIVPKVMLECLSCWPGIQSRTNTILSTFHYLNLLAVLIGVIFFLIENCSDMANVITGTTVLLAVTEVLIRRGVLAWKKRNLLNVLFSFYYEFWPSHAAGNDFQEELAKGSLYLTIFMCVYAVIGFFCGFLFCVIPLITGNGVLPIPTSYWFNWKGSPVYEMLYVWQGFICCAVCAGIGGFDWLFAGLIWNYIAQFKLLSHILQNDVQEILRYNANNVDKCTELLISCIQHHQKLSEICEDYEEVFSLFLLSTMVGNMVTLCLSIVVLVVIPKEFGKMSTYCAAHFCQLLLYCYFGEELILESTALADAAFTCGWHLSDKFVHLKELLLMIMVRSQKKIHVTVGGFAVLSLSSLLKVSKMAFSMYAVLNSVLRKY